MNNFLKKFMSDLAWPAVAGNVAWSLASLAVVQGLNQDTAPRLAVLFVLAIYLSVEWYRNTSILSSNGSSNSTSLMLDFIFVVCIIWFAIGTQENKGMPEAALLIILWGLGLDIYLVFGLQPGKGKGIAYMELLA